ncbi:MAG TPA: hypothetical protein VJ783_09155 [Pirellulales bacterium]|nr:hypothetical protein [Pirellulales bacterium]
MAAATDAVPVAPRGSPGEQRRTASTAAVFSALRFRLARAAADAVAPWFDPRAAQRLCRGNALTRVSAFLFWCAVLLAAGSPLLAQEGGDDPIGSIALDMEEVVIDLSGMATGQPTQESQKQIVGKLEKLIEELEQQSQSMQGGASGPNPSRPAADSVIKGGPGGIGDLHAARRMGKQWAELPPHERDRIVQSMTEGFPAHYQKILERYYKRLAEEKPAGAETDASGDENASDKQDEPDGAKPNAKPAAKPAAKASGAKRATRAPVKGGKSAS